MHNKRLGKTPKELEEEKLARYAGYVKEELNKVLPKFMPEDERQLPLKSFIGDVMIQATIISAIIDKLGVKIHPEFVFSPYDELFYTQDYVLSTIESACRMNREALLEAKVRIDSEEMEAN